MTSRPPRLPMPFRRAVRDPAVARAAVDAPFGAAGAQAAAREPEDDACVGAEPQELGWRSSSYDLKHGLDVVELPTTLPVDVLDRLFNALAK